MTLISSRNALNPTGGATSRPVIEPSSFPICTLVEVLSTKNIQSAWKQVKANHGAPGIDGMSVESFPALVRPKWKDIKQQILAGVYFPQPSKRVEIPKASGGVRLLGIPNVQERLLQQAINQVLTPVFDPTFSSHSFGFRPRRSAHQAIEEILHWYQQGYRIAVDIDLEKFFDTVSHRVLMSRISRRVQDEGILQLIRRYLRSGTVVNGRLNQTRLGVPQGSPLSPLLSNILLDDLDKELEKRGHKFARYADDVMILVKSQRAGERVMQSITRFLEKKLKVKVNREKSKVAPLEERTFLGFCFQRKRFWATEKSVQKFKQRVRDLSSRSWGASMQSRLKSLREYLQGWMGYYAIGLKYDIAVELDHWLRRRIRMCYWKQWKRPRTRIRELLKLGVSKSQAIMVGLSRKGYWKLSKTLSTNMGLTNLYLEKQGLVSIRQLWIKCHYPATAR